jgi:ADP-ribose pyrophosphatase
MYAGYKADEVLHSSPIMVSDPGALACSFGFARHIMFPHSGMTNANMKLVLVGVSFPGELEAPKQKLEPGESIVRRVVELSKLADEMKGS